VSDTVLGQSCVVAFLVMPFYGNGHWAWDFANHQEQHCQLLSNFR